MLPAAWPGDGSSLALIRGFNAPVLRGISTPILVVDAEAAGWPRARCRSRQRRISGLWVARASAAIPIAELMSNRSQALGRPTIKLSQ